MNVYIKRSVLLLATLFLAVSLMPGRVWALEETKRSDIPVRNVSNATEFALAWMDIVGNYGGQGHICLLNDIDWGNGNWEEDSSLRVFPGMDISIDLRGHTLYNNPGTLFAYAHNALFSVEGGRLTLFSGQGDGAIDGRNLCYTAVGDDRCGALIEVLSGTLLLGYNEVHRRDETAGKLQIRHVQNLLSYGSTDPSGGTLINCFGGVIRAYRTSFLDCDGAALWGWNPLQRNGSCDITLEDCTSARVSGLFSSGEKASPYSSSRIHIRGGSYQVGNKYSAGIECYQQSVGNEIRYATFTGGYLATYANGDLVIEGCDIRGSVLFESAASCSITDSRVHEPAQSWVGILSAPPVANVSNRIQRTQVDHCVIGVLASSGGLTLSGEICDNTISGINNAGAVLHLTDGKIQNNGGTGIENHAVLRHSGGTIQGNGTYGVYQDGTYQLYGTARVAGNPIYLCRDRIIHVPADLQTDGFRIATAEDDKRIGRPLVKAWRACDPKLCDKFSLTSGTVSHDPGGGRFTGVRNSAAIHRGADIQGWEAAGADTLYLTGRYVLYFDEDLKTMGFTKDYNEEETRSETIRYSADGERYLYLPYPMQEFYWNEETLFHTEQRPKLGYTAELI